MLLLTALSAWACEEPLRIRSLTPNEGTTGVPLNARMLVSFIGWGDDSQYEVTLKQDGVTVETSEERWCYEHEGPYELHCWVRLTPAEPLSAETAYVLTAETDKETDGPSSTSTRFTTGTETLSPTEGVPSMSIHKVWTEEDKECGYDVARRYLIEVGDTIQDSAAVFHLYSVDEDGGTELIHTIFSALAGEGGGEGGEGGEKGEEGKDGEGGEKEGGGGGDGSQDIKQYLDGELPQTDCFQLVEEDAAGSFRDVVEVCYGEDADTAADTADTAADTAVEVEDTDEEAPEAVDTGTPDEKAGGCGSRAVWLVGLLPLLRRRRRSPGTA